MSALKGEQGDCYQGTAKEQCSKGDACRFRHDDSKHKKKTQSSSPAPKSQTPNDGKVLRKGNLSEAAVLLEWYIRRRADITLQDIARIRRVIFGILRNVKITSLNRDANSVKSEHSGTLRLTVIPANSRRKGVEKDLL